MAEREYYPLAVAAEKMRVSVDDLLHIAANGEIPLILLTKDIEGVLFDSDNNLVPPGVPVAIEYEYCFALKDTIKGYLYEKNCKTPAIFYPDVLITPENQLFTITYADKYTKHRIQLNEASLFVLSGDIKAWLENHQKLQCITWDGNTQPLEQLTDQQKQDYNNWAAWNWVDAIYILQGYKPVFQISTEQVRSHFPGLVAFFTQSIQLGSIGKEINQAGEKTFIDSPANWRVFWRNINKPIPEPQAEAADDAGVGIRGDNPKQTGDNTYTNRTISFKDWQDTLPIDEIKKLTVKQIFNQVKKTNNTYWKIDFETFKRDFWQRYSKENGLEKKAGRPPHGNK